MSFHWKLGQHIMKAGSSLSRDALISGGVIFAIVAALQITMAVTGLDVGPLMALGAAMLIALVLMLVAGR